MVHSHGDEPPRSAGETFRPSKMNVCILHDLAANYNKKLSGIPDYQQYPSRSAEMNRGLAGPPRKAASKQDYLFVAPLALYTGPLSWSPQLIGLPDWVDRTHFRPPTLFTTCFDPQVAYLLWFAGNSNVFASYDTMPREILRQN